MTKPVSHIAAINCHTLLAENIFTGSASKLIRDIPLRLTSCLKHICAYTVDFIVVCPLDLNEWKAQKFGSTN